jgi:hypothetical protein
MAKLSDLPSCFMEAFLKANPNSLVDSNGYLRSEYEEELARRAAPKQVELPNVPDPLSYEPFEEFDVNELLNGTPLVEDDVPAEVRALFPPGTEIHTLNIPPNPPEPVAIEPIAPVELVETDVPSELLDIDDHGIVHITSPVEPASEPSDIQADGSRA